MSSMDIYKVLSLLPHRYPFLLIDRVLDYELNKRLLAIKNVTYNEPFFNGHFPIRPVMPGVLIVEAMAQLGAILILRRFPEDKRMAYFTGIDKARFKRLVVPGDRLELELKVVRDRGPFVIMEGKATVDGQKAAEATMMSILAKCAPFKSRLLQSSAKKLNWATM